MFPASAGMSPEDGKRYRVIASFLRMRGDEPEKKTTKEDTFMLSPYAQG